MITAIFVIVEVFILLKNSLYYIIIIIIIIYILALMCRQIQLTPWFSNSLRLDPITNIGLSQVTYIL